MTQLEPATGRGWVQNEPRVSHAYFILAVLGFSFWFFLAVPFASHRETYSWLAGTLTQTLRDQVAFGGSSTYRPVSQTVIWLLFHFLDPSQFPTNPGRQAVLQCLVYAFFLGAWWLIYSAARERRLFSIIALVTGGVLFSGYIHLFHIYGMMYVPVIMMLGLLLRFRATGTLERRAPWLFGAALVLAFWHPFAPALFVACYSGFYLETFWQRNHLRRILPLLMLAAVAATTVAVAVMFSRDRMPLNSRWAAFIASYRTNELNALVSAAVLVLICLAVASMIGSRRSLFAWLVALCVIAAVLFAAGVPLLMLWFTVVLVKLFRLRLWSLWLLMFSTALLPLGGATGTPTHILFAIIVAAFATALGWQDAEDAVQRARPYYILVPVGAAVSCVVLIRSGVHVPLLSRVATPLLSERERTYQMEGALAWLRGSPYCDADLAYAVNAGSPAQSLESAVTRQNRPPADLEDVLVFWNAILRCRGGRDTSGRQRASTAVMTFGGPELHDSTPVHEVPGRYAGKATVWVSSKSATYTPPQITSGLKTERP